MINQLDEMMRHLLDTRLNDPTLPWTIDVAVRPPDDSWRATVNANGRPAVNVYLVEVREARDQPRNARYSACAMTMSPTHDGPTTRNL
jgi:hypothetical protein